MVEGRLRKRDLGRFERLGAARLRTPPRRMGTTTLVVADSSGNLARIPFLRGRWLDWPPPGP